MAIQIESTVLIARPMEVVFPFLLDLEQSAVTDPDLVSVEKITPGPIGVGTTYVLQQRIQGRLRESTTRYTGIDPNRSIAFEADLGPIAVAASIAFVSVEGGTRVTFHGEGTPRGALKLFSRRFQRIGQHAWDERLAHVEAALMG
ncbi:MAG: SRPBCC family protein [Nitrososphaerota archaeon]